uniref:Autophagy-related protein 11 n=1 Tax=Kalanchoe fedtschenkoi TaxID=63787 RepID=A0A7N0USQ7_KALFE
MSSAVSGGVQAGRLLVHIAENGHSIEIECDESMLVDEVQRYVESMCGIGMNEQLVLCEDLKLEPQRVLGSYKLPSDGREVFVYNKAKLQANSPPPDPERVVVPEIADPPLPSTSRNHPLDDSPDPALTALPSYELQFRYHYHQGLAVYNRSQAKIDICEKLLREQKVQERALEVARGNLEQFYRSVNQTYTEFIKYYTNQHRVHSDLLVNLPRDIEKLRACKLHPSLQTSSRKCLLDFVNEENVKKKGQYCSVSHKQFETKVVNFQKTYNDVKRKVEDLLSIKTSLTVRNSEAVIKEHQQYINEQKSIMQSLSKDVSTVKKLVDDCLGGQLSSSLRPHDAVSALGPMYEVHAKNHLPQMHACDRHISKLLDVFRDKKNEMNQFVHNYMQKITCATYLIKDARLQFPVFREAMLRQHNQFTDLRVLRGIGPSYRASLAEIVRRKAAVKLYMGMAGQLAERLATKREAEIRRREEFLKSLVPYIPQDVLASMGLYETPSQCDVNIAPFDMSLLDIDIQDIDRYAPEHLVGQSSRSDRQRGSRGSLSMSQDSSHSIDCEEAFTGTLNTEDFIDNSELLEIAGTSKIEVENAKLKADLAAKIAILSSIIPEMDMEPLDDSELDNLRKETAEKTTEALRLKDEYGKQLESMLKVKHEQCMSYEKRIQELEQRLSDQYMQGQKPSGGKNASDAAQSSAKLDECKSEISADGDTHRARCTSSSELMEEVSSLSNSLDAKVGFLQGHPGRSQEGVDENMAEYSAMRNTQLDTSMLESNTEEPQAKQSGMASSSTFKTATEDTVSPDDEGDPGSKPDLDNDILMKMRNDLLEKLNELNETDSKLKDAMEEVDRLGKELEHSQKLLDDSQMNCAHLENSLHEAREEAQTNLCAAERRASEYTALRASTVKMRGLFERLRSCVHAPVGMADFVDSLRALSQSLANAAQDNEDDATFENFRQCVHVLAEKIGFLMRHRAELVEKIRKVEASNEQLRKELDEKKELVKTLYTKHQLEKQANKEKISFVRFEVPEIAAFVLNSSGHYEAINRNCSNYYLSPESVALFTDHLPNRPSYIVGQIVHIERRVVKLSGSICSRGGGGGEQVDPQLTTDLGTTDRLTITQDSTVNPYGLPAGCEYFMVTVAMLPNTVIHSTPAATTALPS